ncbi:GNAT family N-acetyltransferase [Chitinophaga sp. SYP-B3965]|uniref:GNAT family N-acetyltransferase n=1 Tax=Chitinophaga sp. SYP-B3965 TaxID=2663120 RepID=UPI001299F1D2|nr:GNAT family N-acetyltransferase [Chitinophaga sp. SYP-B3965]MRG47923.1 GNAT family N-acetyltransferase [Chitinophaga sp. SYP-B3965]
MASIIKATTDNLALIADIGKRTFMESHGHSAPPEDIARYVNEKFSEEVLKAELSNAHNIFHLLYHDQRPAGYSKIILNSPHPDITLKNVTKLERLYLLKDFYNLKLGHELYQFNVELSRKNNQAGIWLYVWKENHRAVDFYMRAGFEPIGSFDFQISATHSNPNHHMFLRY